MPDVHSNAASVYERTCDFELLRSSKELREEWAAILADLEHPEWDGRWAAFEAEYRRGAQTPDDFRTYSEVFLEMDRAPSRLLADPPRSSWNAERILSRRGVRMATAVFSVDDPSIIEELYTFWRDHPRR